MSFAPVDSAPPLDPSSSFVPLPSSAANRPIATAGTGPPSPRSTQDLSASRSCVTCRRRKVKCNKRTPCSNCERSGIECIYPPPGRARRKPSRPEDAQLLSRLRRLETAIDQLGGKSVEGGPSTSSLISPTHQNDGGVANQSPNKEDDACPRRRGLDPNSTPDKDTEFGRLAYEKDRSRYVTHPFWASLSDEMGFPFVGDLRNMLDPSSSEDEDYPTPDSAATRSSNHDNFLFSFHSLSQSLRSYHPNPEKIMVLWDAYLENVAPLVTILHKPTARNHLMGAAERCDSLDKNSEALVFAIYLTTIISMSPTECLDKLGESRDVAVKRYRFAAEQALAKANLLNTQSLKLLQAAVLFLFGVRREDDTKFVWSMNAIVLRLAQGLGLHRDGTNFKLPPFETEMRRRLWWHICLLDIRASEDHGTDFQIHDNMYDTKLPLNVNDDDLSPGMETAPNEHIGFTEMTFGLVRFEVTGVMRRVNSACPSMRFRSGNCQSSLRECSEMIKAIGARVEERYIKYCDLTIPLHWVCATVARLILAKLLLIVHHPMTRLDPKSAVTGSRRDTLLVSSIEVLEFAILMESNENTAKWGWMSQTNIPWHAVAFVLSELCVRPPSPLTARAWKAVGAVYKGLEGRQKKGMLWRPLSQLMKRAIDTRAGQEDQMEAQSYSGPTQEISRGADPQGTLPQFHIPMPPSQQDSSTQSAARFGTGSSVDFDISKGPLDVLQDLFPDTDLLAGSNIPDPAIEQQFASTEAPVDMALDAMTMDSQPAIPDSQLHWDEWDQVLREFQEDVQRAEMAHQIGRSPDWLS